MLDVTQKLEGMPAAVCRMRRAEWRTLFMTIAPKTVDAIRFSASMCASQAPSVPATERREKRLSG